MTGLLLMLAWTLLLSLAIPQPSLAQSTGNGTDGTAREVEESDEAYRRRMELEDARQRDLGYTLPAETYAQQQEKIDKLPEESRDNIRDQLVDLIVENGEWEPGDVLRDYPYEPTTAARADPELLQGEQEAWDEQIEKYHKREAAAYGTYLGPVPGPGNPTGEEGEAQQSSAAEAARTGLGQQAADGLERDADGQGVAGSAGTYEPYRSNHSRPDDEVSTAGAQQSALEFLQGLRRPEDPQAAQSSTSQAGDIGSAAATPTLAETANGPGQSPADSAEHREAQDGPDETTEIDLTTPGIIAIKDLDKLEGTERPDDQAD